MSIKSVINSMLIKLLPKMLLGRYIKIQCFYINFTYKNNILIGNIKHPILYLKLLKLKNIKKRMFTKVDILTKIGYGSPQINGEYSILQYKYDKEYDEYFNEYNQIIKKIETLTNIIYKGEE